MRAISLRTPCSRPWLSSWPVAAWKRRLNSSSLASRNLMTSWSSVDVRRSAAVRPFAITPHPALASRTCSPAGRAWGACASLTSRLTQLSLHELAARPAEHGELVHRAPERLPRDGLGHTRQLEHHPARLHVRDPPLRRTLARTHPGLCGLLGQRT